MTALDIHVRAKRFGEDTVLQDLELKVADGEVVAITGRSGVGKTTLLNIIAGLDTAFEGTVSPGPADRRVGYVFQEPRLLPWRTVTENLCLASRIGPAEAERWLRDIGLAGEGQKLPGQLSLGMQRRVAVARALALRPAVLLLDEPFASLDVETAVEMRALLQRLLAAHPTTTLLVTHDAAEAAELATRNIVLDSLQGPSPTV
ncbi:MAG: ABC transporter ATP-binding protein [Minwuia sp.]|nr:ABC transporter ATP-binding protein [Minwuia sp.]